MNAQDIFLAARERNAEERNAFLDGACGGNQALRAKVEALLAADEEAGGFLDPPTFDGAFLRLGSAEQPGDHIDRYKLLQPIGEGGFGTVWMAEQQEPIKRRVALKVIKLGMDTKQVIARFEAERQALAMMEHPNIAKVLDAGATAGGRPYFVMELVRGVSIVEYCDRERLDTRQRLSLLVTVCSAIQHAHQKGIIHRDIKPSNVLVTLHDGVPVPKVIDFGIAKATNAELTQKTLFTEYRQMVGTPAYMSPEQAGMSGLDIDTRSDIYSLGVLLYELLTGTTPFDHRRLLAAGFAEMIRIIREEEPQKPSTRMSAQATGPAGDAASAAGIERRGGANAAELLRSLRGDLDWIAMRCLEKDRSRRYATAQGLAEDIQRHLRDQPVEAGPPSASYRMRKFIRRNRAGVIAGAAIAGLLVVGVVGTSAGLLWALNERDRADANASEAQEARASEETARRAADANAAGARREAARAKETKRFMVEMLAAINPQVAQGRDTELLRAILEAAAARLDAGEIEDESIEAELRATIGTTLYRLGLYDRAEPQLVASLEVQRRVLGEDDPVTLDTVSTLAGLYLRQFRVAEAAPLSRAAFEGRRRALGEDHPRTLEALNWWGVTQAYRGDLDEAEACYRDALERARRTLGPYHEQTLRSVNNLGSLLVATGRYVEAEPFLRDGLEGTARVFGMDHPYWLMACNNLTALLRIMGKYEDTESLMREGLARCRRVLGEGHPDTLMQALNLSSLLATLGRLDEAETSGREIVATSRRINGVDELTTLNALIGLGDVLAQRLKLDESERCLREAIEHLTGTDAITLSKRAEATLDLGRVLICRGRTGEAVSLLEPAMADWDEDQVAVATGELRAAQGRLGEAEEYFREAIEGLRSTLGDRHPMTLRAVRDLGAVLTMQGKFDEAEGYCRGAFEGLSEELGEGSRDAGIALRDLVTVLAARGQLEEATALARAAVDRERAAAPRNESALAARLTDFAVCASRSSDERLRVEAVAAAREGHGLLGGLDSADLEDDPALAWLVHDSASVLGAALVAQAVAGSDRGGEVDAFGGAEPLLVESAAWMLEPPGTPVCYRDRARQATRRVIDLYDAWHAVEPAGGYDAKADAWRERLASAFGG